MHVHVHVWCDVYRYGSARYRDWETERERAEGAGGGLGGGWGSCDVARTSLHASLRAPSTTSWKVRAFAKKNEPPQIVLVQDVILLQPWKFF